MVYGMLSVVGLFFDLVPLIASAGGRQVTSGQPIVSEAAGNNYLKVVYTTTVRTVPFFDGAMGFMYNLTSVSMIFSPLTWLLASYLAITTHVELVRARNEALLESPWFNEEGRPLLNDTDRGTPDRSSGAPGDGPNPGEDHGGAPPRRLGDTE